jgi:type I restriction enzyme S subunit
MIDGLKPYPAYKYSGVLWLGKVPAHWKVLPHRALFQEVNERSHPDAPLLSVTIARGVIPQEVLLANSSKKDSSNLDKSNYKLVQPGDITYNKMRAWQGALGVSQYGGIVSPAYIVVRPRLKQVPRYYHYLFRTPAFASEAERWSYGITSDQWSLRYEDFKRIYGVLPPLEEQTQIARFLDHHDRLTRRYIRAQRRLIELLTEQKQALIQQAVTRGLDPDVKLKDSGIEWLPKIPEHWRVIRVGSLAASLQTGPFGSQLHSYEYQPNGIPVINPSHMKDGKILPDMNSAVTLDKASQLSRHRLQVGDIIFARRGELGRCALVGHQETGWLCGTGSLRMRLEDEEFSDPEYLVRLFLSKGIAEWLSLHSVGSTMENLNTGILARLPLPLPPKSEQQAIVEHIAEQQRLVGTAITRTQRQIDLIREYRTRLIADVVTGKFDVRGVSLPDLDEAVGLGDLDDLGEDAERDDLDAEELDDADD